MQKVLMVMDSASGAESALAILRTMIKAPESAVLVQVDGSAGAEGAEAPEERVTQRCRMECGAVTVKTLERNADTSRKILEVAREEHVDMIIMGRGRRGLHPVLTRGMMKEVERHATVPVLVGKASIREKSQITGWRGEHAF